MHTGILWFDNSPISLEQKIQKAIDYYSKIHGILPNLCLVHPREIEKPTTICNITVRPYQAILPGHLRIGLEDNTKTTKSNWMCLTGRFSANEISSMQDIWENHFDKMVDMLLSSDPIVTLRALMEIMINTGYVHPEPKFGELLKNKKLSEHWANFLSDPQVDSNDRGYAVTILGEIFKISPELMEAQAEILSQKLK